MLTRGQLNKQASWRSGGKGIKMKKIQFVKSGQYAHLDSALTLSQARRLIGVSAIRAIKRARATGVCLSVADVMAVSPGWWAASPAAFWAAKK